MTITEPSPYAIRHLAALARLYIEYAETHDGVDDPTPWEHEAVANVDAWAKELEKMSAVDQAVLALEVLKQTDVQMGVDRTLTISTSHIPQTTAEKLDAGFTYGLTMFPKGDYGWWFYVADGDMSGLKEGLKEAVTHAKKLGCDWLCLDRDAPAVAELKTWGW